MQSGCSQKSFRIQYWGLRSRLGSKNPYSSYVQHICRYEYSTCSRMMFFSLVWDEGWGVSRSQVPMFTVYSLEDGNTANIWADIYTAKYFNQHRFIDKRINCMMMDPIWNIVMHPFDEFLSYFASWLSRNIKDR